MKRDESNDPDFPKFERGQALQEAISAANKAVLELLLIAARESDRDPLGGLLLGLSEEAVSQFKDLQIYEVLNISKFGAPIFEIRFKEPATLRTLLQSGFSSDVVMRELTKSLPLPEIKRQTRRVS
ncbi:MAG: hypothetical protein EPN64_04465 [Burkholderiaceae bacterium]|nr:MAG: hypothetical protein EPN64_04465 [Burkholderiaceae bacterium]